MDEKKMLSENELIEVKKDILSIRTDMSSLRDAIRELKYEIAEMKIKVFNGISEKMNLIIKKLDEREKENKVFKRTLFIMISAGVTTGLVMLFIKYLLKIAHP
jgi:hypothetical protein